MKRVELRFIVSANSAQSAKKIMGRIQKIVEIDIEQISKYHKGGFEIKSSFSIPEIPWAETVVWVLEFVQRFGYGWAISGDIHEVLEISSSQFKISGVEYSGLYLEKSPNTFA